VDVERWSVERDGPLTEAAARDKLERRGYRVARYVYLPGTAFAEHTHAVDKIDAVLAGRFRMGTPEGEVVLEAGDFLAIPAGTVHRAEVVGRTGIRPSTNGRGNRREHGLTGRPGALDAANQPPAGPFGTAGWR
jgi:mannose-6-phosphate isomerase-like protein (cupin superfamily)